MDTAVAVLLMMSTVYISFNFWAMSNIAVSHLPEAPIVRTERPGSGPKPAPHQPEHGSENDGPVAQTSAKHYGEFHPTKWRPRLMAVVPINWPPKYSDRYEDHLKAILATWGSHVEVLRFVCSAKALKEHPPSSYDWLPPRMKSGELMLGVPMERDDTPKSRNIWEKMWRTWKLIGDEYLDKADFFAKVDVDAYYIAENFRVYASYLDPDEPWYMGHTLYQRWGVQNLVYNSGTLYVLSRETVRQFSIRLRDMKSVCHKCGGSQCLDRSGAGEDPQTGGCLRDLNIVPADTLDAKGRQRFLPFRPRDHLFDVDYHEDPSDWFWRYKGAIGKKQVKRNCCSPYPFSFHNYKTDPAIVYDKNALYELEYFFHSQPYESRIVGVDPPSKNTFQYDEAALDFEIDEVGESKKARDNEKRGIWGRANVDKLRKPGGTTPSNLG